MPVTESGDPRRGAPGAASAVERLVLLLALRQRGRATRRVRADRLDAPARPVRAGQDRASWSPTVTAQLDAYDISGAVRVGAVVPRRADELVRAPVARPVLGRRPRTRSTRSTRCWRRCARVVAPLAPLTAEEIWRGLTGERSVHLTDWPTADEFPADHDLVAAHGRGPRRLLGGAVAAQGQGPAGAAAAAVADRGHAAARRRCGRSPTWSPTRSTSRRWSSPPTWPAHCEQVLTRGAAGARPAASASRCSR